MPSRRVLRSLLAALLAPALTACGPALGAFVNLTPPNTLTGNWRLIGTRTPVTYPLLSTTLIVDGHQITGHGELLIQCGLVTTPIGTYNPSFSSNFNLTGQIEDDGTFQAQAATPGGASAPFPSFQLSLSGTSPHPATPALWTGSYTLSASSSLNGSIQCPYSNTATFTASPISPLTGTYSGPLPAALAGPPGFDPNASVTVQITQHPPALVARGSSTTYQLPLTATMTVTNSHCFTSGTSLPQLDAGSIGGDSFGIYFGMNDGSQLLLAGNLNDLAASTLSVSAGVFGGTCPTAHSVTTLTRQ